MTAAAFTAWLQGAGQDKSFPDFLDYFGLGEKLKPLTKEKKKQITSAARKKSEAILARLRKQKRKK